MVRKKHLIQCCSENVILWESVVKVFCLNVLHNNIYLLKQVQFFFLYLQIAEIAWVACYCMYQRDCLKCIRS